MYQKSTVTFLVRDSESFFDELKDWLEVTGFSTLEDKTENLTKEDLELARHINALPDNVDDEDIAPYLFEDSETQP